MTLHLENISGPILLFGGPYSNLHALIALKEKAVALRIPASNIICTGDIVGYCAFPDEAVQFVKDWGIHCIAGNVELNLREEADDCGCNFDEGSRCDLLSRQWFPFAKANISKDSLAYLHTLPAFIRFEHDNKNYFVLHGSHHNTSEFIFKSTPWKAKHNNFLTTEADVIIAGHCGLPFIDSIGNKTWINAGVIGIPANDGTTDTWYCILDGANATFHRLNYDHSSANKAMLQKPLPTSYAQTLIDGFWDNCDILPPEETKARGKRI